MSSQSCCDVCVGAFGYVTLVSARGDRGEVEAFVVAQNVECSVVLLPSAGVASERDADQYVSAEAKPEGSHGSVQPEGSRCLVEVLGPVEERLNAPGGSSVQVKKVASGAVRKAMQSRSIAKMFEPRPEVATLMTCYYQSELGRSKGANLVTTSTDDGDLGRGELASNNAMLLA